MGRKRKENHFSKPRIYCHRNQRFSFAVRRHSRHFYEIKRKSLSNKRWRESTENLISIERHSAAKLSKTTYNFIAYLLRGFAAPSWKLSDAARSAPTATDSADGGMGRCGRSHSGRRWRQPAFGRMKLAARRARGKSLLLWITYITFLIPFMDASNRAIFASSSALPPSTAKNWKPIGTMTIPSAVIPNAIIGNICVRRCLARAELSVLHRKQ